MPIKLAPIGSVLQFADGTGISLPQIGGAPELFVKQFSSGINIDQTGVLTILSGSQLNIKSGATVQHGVNIVTNFSTTSSLVTEADWVHTGSFLAKRGNQDHVLILGDASNFDSRIVRYFKTDNNSNYIMVSASSGINGQTAISSSDAYAAIELIAVSPYGWRILSTRGTWS